MKKGEFDEQPKFTAQEIAQAFAQCRKESCNNCPMDKRQHKNTVGCIDLRNRIAELMITGEYENEMDSCKNCAWYCHSDGKCYGTDARLDGIVRAQKPIGIKCTFWQFDGLEDWEREESEALMTMEPEYV